MNREISEPQRRVLEILATVNGGRYYFDFLPLVKKTLYPRLWYIGLLGAEPMNYGEDKKRKNTARVVISKGITRLMDRGLIRIIPGRGPGDIKIQLTEAGEIVTANEVP